MKELDDFVLDLLAEIDKLESEVSGFQQMETVVAGIRRAIEVAQAKMEERSRARTTHMTDPFDALGKVLYEKRLHLEPGFGWEPQPGPWETLSDHEREFYCTLAEAVAMADRAAQRRGD